MFVESKPAAYTLSVIMQYAGIVDSEPKYWPYTEEATEFYHADNGLTLFEYGRWRSKDTLDWIIRNDYDGVSNLIKEEIRDLCSQYAANDPSRFQPRLDNLRLLQPIGPRDHTMNHVRLRNLRLRRRRLNGLLRLRRFR